MYVDKLSEASVLSGSKLDAIKEQKQDDVTISFPQTGEEPRKVPERKIEKGDQRPNVSEDMWNWINGNYDTGNVLDVNEKDGGIELKVAMESADGSGFYNKIFRLTKTSRVTTRILEKDENGFTEYYVNNISGKIGVRNMHIVDEDGSSTLVSHVEYAKDGSRKRVGIEPAADGSAESQASATAHIGVGLVSPLGVLLSKQNKSSTTQQNHTVDDIKTSEEK